MAKLTAKQLEALTSADDGKTLREDGGLVAKVRAGVRGVTVLFRYEFKLDGAKRDHRLGSWPKKSLAQIRAERDEVRATVTKGINPTTARKAAKIEAQAAIAATIAEAERQAAANKTVADLFEEWMQDGVSRQDGNAELRRSFTKDVLPLIGKKPLRNLTEKDLLAVLRSIKVRGLNRTVVIRNNDIGQMLRWAEKRKPWRGLMADGNPADLVDVNKLLDHDYQEQRDRLLSPTKSASYATSSPAWGETTPPSPPARNTPAFAQSTHACNAPCGSASAPSAESASCSNPNGAMSIWKKVPGSSLPRPPRATRASARITTCFCLLSH